MITPWASLYTTKLGLFRIYGSERGLCRLQLPLANSVRDHGSSGFDQARSDHDHACESDIENAEYLTQMTAWTATGPSWYSALTIALKAYSDGDQKGWEHWRLQVPISNEAQSTSSFDFKVWNALSQIPWGATWTYGQVAQYLGQPKAARAVGGACGRNPVPLFVPCHRVVSSTGLGGFSGGLEIKRRLLLLERGEESPLFLKL